MLDSDLADLVNGTADVAFGVTLDGKIRCWNSAAAEFFGIQSGTAIGSHCGDHICRAGEIRPRCPVLESAAGREPVPAFDTQLQTTSGPRWVNVSVILVPVRQELCALHVARDIEASKRLEQFARTFLAHVSTFTGLDVEQLIAPAAPPHADLTAQERKILRLLVDGKSTNEISGTLCLSAATVRNHIEHILQKLSSHSRVQAVLRAIREKIV